MASLLFKDMKGVNFSCVSPASAAVCTSIDRRSIVRPTTGRALDRHTPHVRDPRRAKTIMNTHSQAPTRPKSYKQKSRMSLDKPLDLFSPPGSSRYLLNDEAFFDVFPDLEAPPPLVQIKPAGLEITKREEPSVSRPSTSTKQDQVVILRVSLHCKGCEGKVRKHLSKMEGVASFDIDFAAKKVTVVGDVTPLGVLNSISKVKNAQFWPSPPRSSAVF
ncbi:protein SODIUM POTASSIUM ROOT DEFECTIVE 2-like [Typha angustifolia]|uniref:protein SODIUM POTASSIUM ROOT DEFECTIVE 2-like n=1 Tax=Typha angustifolia TaxID=59011 RepID=UPI003C2E6347